MPTLQEITDQIYKLAEEYSIETYPAAHREHLGISIIGEKCSRKIWYSWRWVKLEQFSGQMRRLFQRGHDEEAKFIKMLFWMGFKIKQYSDEGKQYKISVLNGHYGGSTDSKAIIPWLPDEPVILEFKTHNDRLFKELKANKVAIAKPQHYSQLCGYAKYFGFKYGLYCAVNKNTDELYFELVELNSTWGDDLEAKAQHIIYAKVAPNRISDNSSYYECKYCNYNGICHFAQAVEINCRSCRFARPVENARWTCDKFGELIPNDFIKKGCKDHVSITNI